MTKFVNGMVFLRSIDNEEDIKLAVDHLLNGSLSEQMNALLIGTRDRILDARFVSALRATKKSSTKVFGCPISYYAIAALNYLGVETYEGHNGGILSLLTLDFGKCSFD